MHAFQVIGPQRADEVVVALREMSNTVCNSMLASSTSFVRSHGFGANNNNMRLIIRLWFGLVMFRSEGVLYALGMNSKTLRLQSVLFWVNVTSQHQKNRRSS